MARRSRTILDFHQPRFMQISESHCGPAVTQMLLSNLGFEISQEQIAEAGGAANLIAMQGMRVDQLALAVHRLVPDMVFYYKDRASLDDLVRIVIDYRHPVGVEWQGVFEDEEEATEPNGVAEHHTLLAGPSGLLPDSETEDNDYGHYSLVTQAYRRKRQLIIADPYKDYFSQARIFDFDVFEKRWYDFNEAIDPLTGQPRTVEDYHMLFVITRRSVTFPRRLGMHMG